MRRVMRSTSNVKRKKNKSRCFSWCCFLQDQKPLTLVVTLRNVSFRCTTKSGKKQGSGCCCSLWPGRQHLHCSQQEVGSWQEDPEMKICRGFVRESGLWLEELFVFHNLSKKERAWKSRGWSEIPAPRRSPAINNKLEVLTERWVVLWREGGYLPASPASATALRVNFSKVFRRLIDWKIGSGNLFIFSGCTGLPAAVSPSVRLRPLGATAASYRG